MRKSKVHQTVKGIFVILSNIRNALAFFIRVLQIVLQSNTLMTKSSPFRNIGQNNKYSFHCLTSFAYSHLCSKLTFNYEKFMMFYQESEV